MLTTWIGIVCKGCGNRYRTRVRGGSTRCRKCNRQRYVRKDQAPEWDLTPSTAPARGIRCKHCDHTWETTATGGQTIRCPACRKPRRVPLDESERIRPRGRTLRPAVRDRRPPAAPEPWEEEDQETAPAGPSPLLTTLQALLSTYRPAAPTVPAPRPRPAASSTPAAPPARPAAPPKVTPAPRPRPAARPSERPWEIPGQRLSVGPRTAGALATLALGPLAADVRPGSCAMLDTRMGRGCNAPATHRAVWDGTAYAPVCDGHAYAIRTRATDRGLTVQITPL